MKLAVVLFNLGGPDSMAAVRPFLRNLFSDRAIINLPAALRLPIAAVIAWRRAPFTRSMYDKIGGRSPLLEETEAQAAALENALKAQGLDARCFIAMRHWRPYTEEAAIAVKEWNPGHIVLLPLYPQYSSATTASSFAAWERVAHEIGLDASQTRVCCYPWDANFVGTEAELVKEALGRRKPGLAYRLLFSAHGLPEKVVFRGDPYQWQIEQTAEAILHELDAVDWQLCYQSRVGPLKWIGPQTDEEIRRAGKEGKAVIVVPISFVSEHSETLVELDILYRDLAAAHGVPDYIRVPTARTHPKFVAALAGLVSRASSSKKQSITCADTRICHAGKLCGFGAI